MSREYKTKSKIFNLGDFIADSVAIVVPIWKIPDAIKITAVKFAVDTAITAQDTDYNTIALTDGTNTID